MIFSKQTLQKIEFALLMSLFGCLGPLVRAIGLPSEVTACLRAWISALALIGYVLVSGRRYDRDEFKKAFVPMMFCGIFLAIDWLGLFASYNYTTIATSTICYYVSPVLVFFLSPVILGEKFTLKHLACAILAFAGMALISGIVENGLPSASDLKGIAFALLGAAGYAGVVLMNKKFPTGDSILRTTIQLAVAAVLTTPYILMKNDVSSLSFTPKSFLLLLVLGIGLTALTYIVYFHLILKIPGRSVSIFSYADPTVAVLISVIFLGESISVLGIVGAVLVIASAIVSEFN